jgi:hypothetical protein
VAINAIPELNELCPSCGNFVDALYESTGFCESCSNGVGVFDIKTPTPNAKQIRLELWLTENADTIEDVMLADNITAKDAIRILAQNDKPVCQICGDDMPHTTPGRHVFCKKREGCRKARRYYSYLVYEKGIEKDHALRNTLERFSE